MFYLIISAVAHVRMRHTFHHDVEEKPRMLNKDTKISI